MKTRPTLIATTVLAAGALLAGPAIAQNAQPCELNALTAQANGSSLFLKQSG